jgi:hypothetical protein
VVWSDNVVGWWCSLAGGAVCLLVRFNFFLKFCVCSVVLCCSDVVASVYC